MTLSNEIALTTNGTQGVAVRGAIGASGIATKLSQLEDYAAIEVGRLLEDVTWALNCDLSAAKISAARLAAFLESKIALDVSSAPAHGGLAPWQKRKVKNHIGSGLEGPLPVEELAKLVSLSPSYFCRAFKDSFGEPPHAYVIKMRVERARTLMLTTCESLSQIALACGLVDQAHLCRCFRRVTGTTPAVWRRSRATGALRAGLAAVSHEVEISGA